MGSECNDTSITTGPCADLDDKFIQNYRSKRWFFLVFLVYFTGFPKTLFLCGND